MIHLDSITKQKSINKRKPLSRTRTIDGAFPRQELATETAGGISSDAADDTKPKVKKNLHVRFADASENKTHEFDRIDPETEKLSDYWVLPDELKEIKKTGFLACNEAKRTGLAGLLTEIYGTANDNDTQDRLNYWCRMASACRGLERYASEELSKRRMVYRKRAIVSVLEAQQQLKNEKGIDTANVLRRLSEAYTEQSRLFAEKLGAADHQALQNLANPTPPPPISPESVAKEKKWSPKTNGRKSRMERMKDRHEKMTAAQESGQGDNVSYRRNNTTMSAVVLKNQR